MRLTQDRLRAALSYDPDSGEFHWRISPTASVLVGTRAGNVAVIGYRRIRLDNKLYWEHRLAWLYIYGVWPTSGIDHKDGDPLNNRICNLREAAQKQNNGNARKPTTNTTGYKGVRRGSTGSWYARLYMNGKTVHLGTFRTAEAASDCYLNAAKSYFGEEFARRG